jgi:hypothetical protein
MKTAIFHNNSWGKRLLKEIKNVKKQQFSSKLGVRARVNIEKLVFG